MENEELIRKQMDETRSSISEKLETLEQKVSGDIQGATGAVTGTVEAVKDTVESVKDSVTETVENVKDSVAETAETVKEAVQEGLHSVARWFDIPSHVRNYPWLSVGVAAGAGFLLESTLVSSSSSGTTGGTAPFSQARGFAGSGVSAASTARSERSGPSWLSAFAPQLTMLRQVALGALLNAIKEPVMNAVPSQREALTKLFESVSEKFGVETGSDSSTGSAGSSPSTGYSTTGDSNGGVGQFGRSRAGSPLSGNHGQG